MIWAGRATRLGLQVLRVIEDERYLSVTLPRTLHVLVLLPPSLSGCVYVAGKYGNGVHTGFPIEERRPCDATSVCRRRYSSIRVEIGLFGASKDFPRGSREISFGAASLEAQVCLLLNLRKRGSISISPSAKEIHPLDVTRNLAMDCPHRDKFLVSIHRRIICH